MKKTDNYLFLFLIFIIIIVFLFIIYKFTTRENFYSDKLEKKDLVIFKQDPVYNLGDLLCMPKFYCNYISGIEHWGYRNAIEVYKDSILAIYETLRESPEEIIPNIEKVRKSVDIYIEKNMNNQKMMENIEFVKRPNVLCVHLRTGDYGHITDKFKQIIFDLQKEYEYVVIMCGVHYATEQVYDIVLNSVNALFDNENKNVLISIEDPDIHMAMFRSCHNLLLSKQGFSMLAGLLFQGDKLYICKEVFDQNFPISQTSWMDYIQPETRIFKELIYV